MVKLLIFRCNNRSHAISQMCCIWSKAKAIYPPDPHHPKCYRSVKTAEVQEKNETQRGGSKGSSEKKGRGGPYEWEERVRGPYCALPSLHEGSPPLTCPSCPPGARCQETEIRPPLQRGERHEQGWAMGDKWRDFQNDWEGR